MQGNLQPWATAHGSTRSHQRAPCLLDETVKTDASQRSTTCTYCAPHLARSIAATLHGWQCTDTDTMRPAEHALVLSFLLTPRAVAARRFASAYLEADVLVKPAEHQRRFPLQIHLAHTASEEEKRECSTKCAGYKSNPPALSRMSTNLHGAVGESTRRQ